VFSRSPQLPYWNDPWVRQWETFRRHLVSVHYTELAQWLVEAGVPSDRIWSSQGLMAPAEGCMPLALRVTSAVKDYDSGGVSIEGSKPRDGHLGAIVYGDAATNAIAMENGSTLFATLAAIDDGFAIVEFNTADLRFPERQPTYAAAYRAWRDLWNAGARLVSPMAWNGSNGENASDPGYVSFTAWRNTPLEEAARDFLLARSGLPRGSKLWTFGTQAHPDDDGWTAEAGSLATSPGALQLDANWHGVVTLRSPAGVELEAARIDSVVLGLVPDAGIARIEIAARGAKAARWQRLVRCEGRAIEWVEAGARLHGTRGVDGPIDRLRIAITVAKRARITLARVAILMR
jgi:hypothetical protein